MTGAEIFALLNAIQAAIAAAPKAIEVVTSAKQFITSLFTAGVINKAQQDIAHAYVDNQAAMFAEGIIPEHWKVQTPTVT